MMLAMTSDQLQGAVSVVFALGYLGLCALVLFVSGDGLFGVVRGRLSVLVALLQYAMAVVGFVGTAGLIAVEPDDVTLTMIAAYIYLAFVVIRFKEPLMTKYRALTAPQPDETAGGIAPKA